MEIWLWIIGILAAVTIIAMVVERRRGSTGASRAYDRPGTQGPPPSANTRFGGGGGDGGGG
jgi:hypothetical protein